MSDTEIAALAEEAVEAVVKEHGDEAFIADGYAANDSFRDSIAAAIRKALAANDAERDTLRKRVEENTQFVIRFLSASMCESHKAEAATQTPSEFVERNASKCALCLEKRVVEAEEKFKAFEHEVMTGRDAQHDRLVADKEKATSRIEALTAKLQRARDFIKFTANSEGGLVAEIDAALEGGTAEVKGGE